MRLFAKALTILILSFSFAYAAHFKDIANKYASIKTLKTQFKQKVFLASLGSERVFSGSFYYKKGRGFLWMYENPKKRYFLFDGTYLYRYDEEKPFVIKEKIDSKKSHDLFLDLINDLENLDKYFVLLQHISFGEKDIFLCVPKTERLIASVEISFGKDMLLEKIEIVEKNGNKNILLFRSVSINEEIDDGMFLYKKEIGKELIVR